MEDSSSNKGIVWAYNKGYRSDKDGNIISHKNNIIKLHNQNGYLRFTIRPDYLHSRKTVKIACHRLVAYCKYKEAIFENDIVVRHKDGNSLNNSWENILIGTQSDNMMDKKPENRLNQACNATVVNRKFTDEEMDQIRFENANGKSYNELMKKWNISSKGTLSYIINNKYKTVKNSLKIIDTAA